MYDSTKPQASDLQKRRLYGNLSVPDLRECRLYSNLSVIEVQSILDQDFEIRTSDKTIYGWEAGRSLPVPSTFMAICQIYGIRRLSSLNRQNGINPGTVTDFNISAQPDTRPDIGLHRNLCSTTPVHLCITKEELHMLQICRLHPALMNKAMQELLISDP